MKKIVLFLAVLAVLSGAGQAQAATTKAATPQQNRMKTCAAEYHKQNIAKSQYRAFMSKCLKTSKTAAGKTSKKSKTAVQ
jgi:hypothetical protein